MTRRRFIPFTFRPYYGPADEADVVYMLQGVTRLYPGGERWLKERLREADTRRARVTVAEVDGQLAGLMIETSKGPRRLKLSTLYVASSYRRRGLGGQMLALAQESWRQEGREEVYLTAAAKREDRLLPMLLRRHFVPASVAPERYGPGRDEVVLSWRPTRVVPQVALFSFKPSVTPLLWDGRKRHEFRKNRRVALAPGSLVLVYETTPVKAVTGCFYAGQVSAGDPARLVRLEEDRVSRRVARDFLAEAKLATAIEVLEPTRFEAPLALPALTGFARPPMSYAFLR